MSKLWQEKFLNCTLAIHENPGGGFKLICADLFNSSVVLAAKDLDAAKAEALHYARSRADSKAQYWERVANALDRARG